jgi:hypothetical protein
MGGVPPAFIRSVVYGTDTIESLSRTVNGLQLPLASEVCALVPWPELALNPGPVPDVSANIQKQSE